MRLAFILLLGGRLFAQSGDSLEFFEKKIRPILTTNCYVCHGPTIQTSGLNFSSPEGLAKVVSPGDPGQSRLYKAVSYAEKIKMPPTGKLKDRDIADLKTWIESGASLPKETAAVAANPMAARLAEGKKYWAFQPIQSPTPPNVKNEKWVKSPIDRFILAKLEEKSIPAPAPAAKLTLLRRATFDLTGLPPSLKEIGDFLADNSPDAFAKVVDRLLASPQYGENWGRHWLDVVRYADSTGMDEDHVLPNAWRYRDYVVKAFNEDTPFDRFLVEQIAGDLLPPDKPGGVNERGIVATGLLALGPRPLAQQDRVQAIYDVVDEQIDTTTKAFMGLTVACARCHDHKFDPILTKDYYSLAGIFASTEIYRNLGSPGSVSFLFEAPLDPSAFGRYQAARWTMYGKQLEMEEALAEDWAREYALMRPKIAESLVAAWKAEHTGAKADDPQAAKWLKWIRAADEKARQGYLKSWFDATEATIDQVARSYQERYLKAAIQFDEALESWRRKLASDIAQQRDLPKRPTPADLASGRAADAPDPFFAAATFNGGPMELADSPRVALARKEWKDLEASLPPEPPMAQGVRDSAMVDQKVFLHGSLYNLGEPAPKQFPTVLAGESQHPITKGSGRLEFAQWLASPNNPLTARVFVNRVWQGHFGEGLVRTPNNWGIMGEKPTHPELLDYLAKRFVDGGWSIKAMHRTIMLSSAYQMSSQAAQPVRDVDPANLLWSRFNRIRMTVEQIRDGILALSGNLDLTLGGSLLPTGPAVKGSRQQLDPDDLKRRTLYIPVRRGNIPVLLTTFDYGDATTAGDGRSRTNVAPQALFMINSRFVVERSKDFAKRLLDDAALSDKERIERAYLMVLTRSPEPDEIDSALTYIGNLEKQLGKPDSHLTAWQSLCQVLIATNEFLYLN
jgi:cytochrome c553